MGLRGVVLMAHPPSIDSVFVTEIGRALDLSSPSIQNGVRASKAACEYFLNDAVV
jgi:hypothetical protein